MEEQKQELHSMVHMASRSRPQKGKNSNGKGSTLTYTHCGEDGHFKLQCYEIIGCLDWWDFIKKPMKKISQATVVTSSKPQEVTTPMAAHTFAHSGMLFHNHTRNSNSKWVIDTGATDDMTKNSKILQHCTLQNNWLFKPLMED